MKLIAAMLLAFLLILQYHLWAGDGGLAEVWRTQQLIEAQQQENNLLKERNRAEEAEVADLKHGLEAIGERARAELGMISKDETFYQLVNE
ncbi:MAG: cell division protein FtsB [Gammaproteobacteria bacterium]